MVIGLEVGESTGTPHMQGFVSVVNRMRFGGLRSRLPPLQRAALLVSRGSDQQNRTYCTKDSNVLLEIGVPKPDGKRSDLLAIKELIDSGVSGMDIADQYFSKWVQYRRSFEAYRDLRTESDRSLRLELRVIVYWGKPGTGKTRKVFEENEDLYIHAGGEWFDGYRGQQVVLFDDFRRDVLPLDLLLRVLDIYPILVPIKGGFTPWRPTKIYITSNVSPQGWCNYDDYPPLQRRLHEIVEF